MNYKRFDVNKYRRIANVLARIENAGVTIEESPKNHNNLIITDPVTKRKYYVRETGLVSSHIIGKDTMGTLHNPRIWVKTFDNLGNHIGWETDKQIVHYNDLFTRLVFTLELIIRHRNKISINQQINKMKGSF